ncbi:MAG: hypothetical protein HN390_09850 [Anaerolineae bacterium]|jgi:VanZ family protein|nr:hypothetical protein [Anaerolineae bacterium]MBT7191370.1 hypothetical protein [Anaerolineae bacterium]MBT7991783.1 hypothetical protein [Anaerolineae bacterium]
MRKKRISILLVIFALIIVILADSGNLPRPIKNLYDFPYGDKVGHFLLTGLLSLVLNWTALTSRASKAARNGADIKPAFVVLAVSLTLTFFVTLEELSQQLFPRRTFSLLDLLFSYAGIVLFAWATWFFQSRRSIP